jgi:hypothetical protein
MCRHVCALQHLGKSTKRTHNVLNQLKCRLGTLAERLRQALGVVGVAGHAHPPIHPTHAHATAVHASHTHATTIHPAHPAHPAET